MKSLFLPPGKAVAGAGDAVQKEGEFQRDARAGRCAGARQLGAAASSAAGGRQGASASSGQRRRRRNDLHATVSDSDGSDSELSYAGSDGGEEAGADCVVVWSDGEIEMSSVGACCDLGLQRVA